jgi:hypothetical protein
LWVCYTVYMNLKNNCRLFFYTLILCTFVFVSTPSFSYAFSVVPDILPFGGKVTVVYPCNTGLLVYIKSIKGIIPLMWLWGELPFLSHVPPHPGQYILGRAFPTPVPCILGIIPIGVGFPIIYHGSSL